MKLKDWLEANEIAPAIFARRIDRTAETVRRYIAGERIPDKATMPLIVAATAGVVTANDFFDISVATCPNCDLRADDPQVRSCIASNCGLAAREREAA